MDRAKQLRERDVRQFAPQTNSADFLSRYLASNFPETASIPSQDQKGLLMQARSKEDGLKYMQKPRQGTTYDNPGGF